LDNTLSTNIFEAQRRLNILGGEVPNRELMIRLQEYIKQIPEFYDPPQWVLDLEKRYGIKSYRGDGKPAKENAKCLPMKNFQK
jgi:hypothetical protein